LTHPLSLFCYTERRKNKADQGTSEFDDTKEFNFSGNLSNPLGPWFVSNHRFDPSACFFDTDRALEQLCAPDCSDCLLASLTYNIRGLEKILWVEVITLKYR
jgi:hypothetical protein